MLIYGNRSFCAKFSKVFAYVPVRACFIVANDKMLLFLTCVFTDFNTRTFIHYIDYKIDT